MSENVTDNITTNIPYNIPTAVPIISSSPKITLVCRNCDVVFQRPASVSPAHNEYYRCNKCRGIQSMDFLSLCSIQ